MSLSSSGVAVSSLGACVVVVASSTVERSDMAPVMKGPVDDTGWEPLGPC